MVQAQIDFNKNPGLHNFLGYTVNDFYILRMQEEKYQFATSFGYADSKLANYTSNPPEAPPE